MPEEQNSPGNQPGKNATPRRPTLMRTDAGRPAVAEEAPVPARRKPTVIKINPQTVPLPVSSGASVQAGPRRPSVVVGSTPSRLAVTVAELEKYQSKSHRVVLEKAIILIGSIPVTNITERDAILWGSDIQKRNSQLVGQSLDMSKMDVLEQTSQRIRRLIEILSSIDIMKALDRDQPSAITRMFRRATAAIDTPAELENAEREIAQLIQLVQGDIDRLLEVKAKAETISKGFEEVQTDAEASSVAAVYIAEYFKNKSQPDLANRFTERSVSLTATYAQIQSTGSVRKVQIEQPLQLIGMVQNVVLVTVPSLLSNIAALRTMQKGQQQPTFTDINEAREQIRKTLEGLRKE